MLVDFIASINVMISIMILILIFNFNFQSKLERSSALFFEKGNLAFLAASHSIIIEFKININCQFSGGVSITFIIIIIMLMIIMVICSWAACAFRKENIFGWVAQDLESLNLVISHEFFSRTRLPGPGKGCFGFSFSFSICLPVAVAACNAL